MEKFTITKVCTNKPQEYNLENVNFPAFMTGDHGDIVIGTKMDPSDKEELYTAIWLGSGYIVELGNLYEAQGYIDENGFVFMSADVVLNNL